MRIRTSCATTQPKIAPHTRSTREAVQPVPMPSMTAPSMTGRAAPAPAAATYRARTAQNAALSSSTSRPIARSMAERSAIGSR
ncbi:hypothetical protein FAB82_06865 [Glycomyces buryatensis]|uniref:Uncharacterized protein n=1 Tax=Glycomyces buryatensis TaxID=2570927 RepID=A0A4S8QDI2_9ACTN|nr:hypothetical protein FAB82_06865 [Glycomyces buryatensis]